MAQAEQLRQRDFANRFGNIRFGDLAPDWRGGTTYGQAYDTNYGDSINQLGTMFGQTNPTELLPANYLSGKVRAKGKDRPLATVDRYPKLEPLEPNDEEIIQRYLNRRRAANAPNAEYVLSTALPRDEQQPLTKAQRKALAREARMAREKALAASYRDDPEERYTAEDLLKRQRKIKKFQKEMAGKKYWDPVDAQVKEQDEAYLRQVRALQNIGRSLPATIRKPQYTTFLRNPAIVGYQPDEIPEDDPNVKRLIGHSLQTLSPEDRNDLMLNLYKTVAVLNATPVLDKRLLTVRSAQQVYNPDDYYIYNANADGNILTPGVCVVRTKYDSTNSKGQFVPAGTYISIGGWTLVDASEARSLQNLKDIMYYSTFPTKKLRSQNKRSDYIGALFGTRQDLGGATGLKRVSQMLRKCYAKAGFYIPQKIRVESGQFMDVPTYIQLTAYKRPDKTYYDTCTEYAGTINQSYIANDEDWDPNKGNFKDDEGHATDNQPVVHATLKLSTPVFNTFISWVAKLFFNMIMLTGKSCPFKFGSRNPKIQEMMKSVQAQALAHGILGEEIKDITYAPNKSNSRYDVNLPINPDNKTTMVEYEDKWGKIPSAWEKDALVQINELWNKSYFDDTALTQILRDENILDWINAECETIETKLDDPTTRDAIIKLLKQFGHVILFYTMNSAIPDYLDDIVHEAVDDSNFHKMYRRYVYAYGADIKFLTRTDCQALLAREIDQENSTYTYHDYYNIKFHNVTKKPWQTVIAEAHLSRRCYTWVGKSTHLDVDKRVLLPSKADYEERGPSDNSALIQSFADTRGGRGMSIGNLGDKPVVANGDWMAALRNENPYAAAQLRKRSNEMSRLLGRLATGHEDDEEDEAEKPQQRYKTRGVKTQYDMTPEDEKAIEEELKEGEYEEEEEDEEEEEEGGGGAAGGEGAPGGEGEGEGEAPAQHPPPLHPPPLRKRTATRRPRALTTRTRRTPKKTQSSQSATTTTATLADQLAEEVKEENA